MEEKELKKLLVKESEEFRNVYQKHQEYERKLEKFKNKSFLTDEEILQEKEWKKKKLAFKDKMYFLMAEYRKAQK